MGVTFGSVDTPIKIDEGEVRRLAEEELQEIARKRDQEPQVKLMLMARLGGKESAVELDLLDSIGGAEVDRVKHSVQALLGFDMARVRRRLVMKYRKKVFDTIVSARCEVGLMYIMEPDRDINAYHVLDGPLEYGLAVERISPYHNIVAICILKNGDVWSNKTAKGLLGWRLLHSPILDLEYKTAVLSAPEVVDAVIKNLHSGSRDKKLTLPKEFSWERDFFSRPFCITIGLGRRVER